MTRQIYILILTLSSLTEILAQTRIDTATNSHKKKLFGYISVYTSYGELFTRNPQLDLSISFPYLSSTQGSNLQNFSTNLTNLSPKNFMDFEALHMDISLQNFFIDCGGGWFAHKNSNNPGFRGGFLVYLGAGYSIPFDFNRELKSKEKRLSIQASINWSVNNFNIDIGSINNNGTTLSVLGITAAPTYTYIAHHGRQSYTVTDNASSLNFFLDEEYQFINPKISITTNPLKYKLHCGVSIAYNIPISHTETLSFVQSNNNKNAGSGGQVSLSDKNLTAVSHGNKVNSVLFNLNGVCVTLSAGFNIRPL